MANPFGSGSAFVMPPVASLGSLGALGSRSRDGEALGDEPSSGVRARGVSSRPVVLDAPETIALVNRIVAAVAKSEEGLTALEMRVQFNERPDRLQKALAAALRARRIRRSGSRCQTRYLANR
jgi:hypothetical protein